MINSNQIHKKTAEQNYEKYGVDILCFFSSRTLMQLLEVRKNRRLVFEKRDNTCLVFDDHLLHWIFDNGSKRLQQLVLNHLNSVRRPKIEQMLADQGDSPQYSDDEALNEAFSQIEQEDCRNRFIEVVRRELESGAIYWGGSISTSSQEDALKESVTAFLEVHQQQDDVDPVQLIKAWTDLAQVRRTTYCESPILEQLLNLSQDEVLKDQIHLRLSGASDLELIEKVRADQAHLLMEYRNRLTMIRTAVEIIAERLYSPEEMEQLLSQRFSVKGDLPLPTDPPQIREEMVFEQVLVNLVSCYRLVCEGGLLNLESTLFEGSDPYVALGFQNLVDGLSSDLVLSMMHNRHGMLICMHRLWLRLRYQAFQIFCESYNPRVLHNCLVSYLPEDIEWEY